MAKGKNYEDLSTEKLKKLLLIYNILAILGGVGAITAIVFYFLNREEGNHNLLLLGAVVGVAISSISTIAKKIKKEIKDRDVKN